MYSAYYYILLTHFQIYVSLYNILQGDLLTRPDGWERAVWKSKISDFLICLRWLMRHNDELKKNAHALRLAQANKNSSWFSENSYVDRTLVTQTELAELYSWRGGVLVSIIKELRRGVCPQFSHQHKQQQVEQSQPVDIVLAPKESSVRSRSVATQ